MARQELDKSSKWLIQHYGGAIPLLAGAKGIVKWKALQAELVQPRRLPDGLLEVVFAGQKKPNYILLEVATHPEKRLLEQVVDDMMLAYQQLHVLPELLTLVLAPKGRFGVTGQHNVRSQLEWSEFALRWKVVELWSLSAANLLKINEVGLIPWIPLTHFDGPVEDLFNRCRQRIEQKAPYKDQQNLFAVSQVLASLRYTDEKLLSLLGGGGVMPEFPLIQKLMAERMHENITRVLRARFGEIPQRTITHLHRVRKEKRLEELLDHAAVCPDLRSFEAKLRS